MSCGRKGVSFVDASVIVAILNEEPGFEELEKRLSELAGQLYVSPMVRFEAVAAVVKTRAHATEGKLNRAEAIAEARTLVDAFIEVTKAREVVIDTRVGFGALDAMASYGKLAGHPADLNLGDCFAYAAAKSHRLPLIYK